MSLSSAIQHLLKAKRISLDSAGNKKNSYFDDNNIEATKVFAYLNGGARPTGVVTEMGVGLIEVEDERRATSPSNVAVSAPTGGVT